MCIRCRIVPNPWEEKVQGGREGNGSNGKMLVLEQRCTDASTQKPRQADSREKLAVFGWAGPHLLAGIPGDCSVYPIRPVQGRRWKYVPGPVHARNFGALPASQTYLYSSCHGG